MALLNEGRIFGGTFESLEGAMERQIRIQEVIAHNIANAKTPGYRALVFDTELKKAIERTDNPAVSLDDEMAALVENRGAYSSLVRLMSSKINMYRTVATQGRR